MPLYSIPLLLKVKPIVSWLFEVVEKYKDSFNMHPHLRLSILFLGIKT